MQSADTTAEVKIFKGGKIGVQGHHFRQVAQVSSGFERLLGHIETGYTRLARCRREVTRDDAHCGGLTRTVRAEETENLATFDVKRNVAHGGGWPVVFGQVLHFYHVEITSLSGWDLGSIFSPAVN